MCGIIGYIGKQSAGPVILEGLRRLEYRGYDSAGLCVSEGKGLNLVKRVGKIDNGLGPLVSSSPVQGRVGVGHTRWATHGAPSDQNAHPHLDQSGRVAVVHNGVIENHETLKGHLELEGCEFESETDSEILAKLIGLHYQKAAKQEKDEEHPLARAVSQALKEVIGTYGIAVVSADDPDTIVGARRGSPLIIGVGQDENFLVSDVTAAVAHTRQVVYLNDYDVVTLTADNFHVTNLGTQTAQRQISEIEFSPEAAELGDFPHYMLKEIFEQPRTVENAMRGRLDHDEVMPKMGGLNMTPAELRAVEHVVFVACGTSWHAALAGEYALEEFAHIPVTVEYASEFRYRNAPIEKGTLVVAITQSGETADTYAALREANRRGHKGLAVCNVVGSSIAREADGGIYLHAGPEIGVASTKAFTSQATVLSLLGLLMGRMRMLSVSRGMELMRALEQVPEQISKILEANDRIRSIALKYSQARHFFFIGRQYNFPTALEGALKLKEISYIHAEGYPAAEMKHGPIAMIDEATPTVVLIPSDSLYEKTFSNLKEIKARKGPIIAIASEGNDRLENEVDDVIYVPRSLEPMSPLLNVIPLQLLAYHIAVERGCDVDKPRNLAKSVTVE